MIISFSDVLHASVGISNDEGDPRHELRLAGMLGDDGMTGGTLAAILLPCRQGAALPEFSSANRADAFQALFMTTRLGMPGPPKLIAEKLSRLVGRAPVYFVDTGTDPGAIPDAFAQFLATLVTH